MSRRLIFVDCEAPFGGGAPSVSRMTEFGAVDYESGLSFHGKDASLETFQAFHYWVEQIRAGKSLSFVSDNPAYDWQWMNFYFWQYFNANPFGHSARRIGDFYAGLVGDFNRSNEWKALRVTPHDHNPVNDAKGNAEAFRRMLSGERVK